MLRALSSGLRVVLIGAAALTSLAACTSDPSEGGADAEAGASTAHVVITPSPPTPGIAMSVIQQRIDEGTIRAELRIANITDDDLRVRRVGVRWAGFAGPMTPRVETVGSGATLDLPMALGAPDCTAGVGDPETAPVATGLAVVVTPVGLQRIRRPIDEAGMRFLTRLWSEACARERVTSLLTLAWSVPEPAPGQGEELTMHLALERTGADGPRVALVQAAGTVLFDLRLPRGGDRALRADADTARLPVLVDPGRCDEHARSQASQPVTFRVWLQIGGDTATTAAVVLPDATGRRRLLRFLDIACGNATAH